MNKSELHSPAATPPDADDTGPAGPYGKRHVSGAEIEDNSPARGAVDSPVELAAECEPDHSGVRLTARLFRLEEAVRNLIPAQKRRSEQIESRIDGLEAVLLGQIADLENRNQASIATLDQQLTVKFSKVQKEIETAESARRDAEKRAEEAELRATTAAAHTDAFRLAWHAAPLTLRLKFVRELVPEDHPAQAVLKEAAALEELRRRGRDLETWLANYPSLFADAVQSIEFGLEVQGCDGEPSERRPDETGSVDILMAQTLGEARDALESTLGALGITWIAPSGGDSVLAEHEVVATEESPHPQGHVARLRRRGFRIQGRLALPAQVTRAAPIAEPPVTSRSANDGATEPVRSRTDNKVSIWRDAPEPGADRPAAPEPTPLNEETGRAESLEIPVESAEPIFETGADVVRETGMNASRDLPDWLRLLVQRTYGCDVPEVVSTVDQILALNELPARLSGKPDGDALRTVLTDALQPLIPVLGIRYADGISQIPEKWGAAFLEVREPLLAWLHEKLDIDVLVPTRGDAFDPKTMEAVEIRRTVHVNEDETIARIERAGVSWRGRPLVRAQVIRYASEGVR